MKATNLPADIVRSLTIDFMLRYQLASPEAINTGWCFKFARELVEKLPGAQYIERSTEYACHAFVGFKGRFYDSETPEGVSQLEELPYFARIRRERSGEETNSVESWMYALK